ncbi:hypothetical protein H2200_004506 [Cladophialophora chaetospira]|uniref:DUF218 domain-containing protein n=1 Tax=Cladophialophora chaetospira TaxID=386627 RepID=A0AA38XDB6_9EURO|nr:hypothetical protein H2200_004506 [Cladophialophora chaetospira]
MPTPPTHLIIVCCHAIYIGGEGKSSNEANWLIEPFQSGETETYVKHVEAGVKALAEDYENAILCFSGGPTKPEKTKRSEGEGYLKVALENNLFGREPSPPTLRSRIFVDRYATDSYQNILLSLIQFPLFTQELDHRLRSNTTAIANSTASAPRSGSSKSSVPTGTKSSSPVFPTKLTIISHSFKRARFLELHLSAIKYPLERVTYIGIDPPFDTARMSEIEEGDRLRGYGAWKKDLYGASELLRSKREKRGWNEAAVGREIVGRYMDGEAKEGIERLLAWGSCSERYPGRMPWELDRVVS